MRSFLQGAVFFWAERVLAQVVPCAMKSAGKNGRVNHAFHIEAGEVTQIARLKLWMKLWQ